MSEAQSQELQRALGRIEGKLDAYLVTQQAQSLNLIDHDKRISVLERWKYGVVVLGSAAGAVGGLVMKILLKV